MACFVLWRTLIGMVWSSTCQSLFMITIVLSRRSPSKEGSCPATPHMEAIACFGATLVDWLYFFCMQVCMCLLLYRCMSMFTHEFVSRIPSAGRHFKHMPRYWEVVDGWPSMRHLQSRLLQGQFIWVSTLYWGPLHDRKLSQRVSGECRQLLCSLLSSVEAI